MSDQASQLCKLCDGIDIVSLISGLEAYKTRTINHQPSYAALLKAADAGCRLCVLFHATLGVGARNGSISSASRAPFPLSRSSSGLSISSDNLFHRTSSHEDLIHRNASSWHTELDKTPLSPGYVLEVEAESTLDTDFTNQFTVHLSRRYAVGKFEEVVHSRKLLLSNDYDLGLGIRNREISRFPSYITYSQWIRSCARDSKHSRCCKAEPVPLPSRVIDVGSGSGTEVPKLIETNGMEGFYITLSHCWGKTRPLTTTMANRAAHSTGLSISKFPKQFSDAAIITKILGYRYLWIDSLCIVQDDAQDWDSHCFRMGDIYRQSVCTLAAPVASGSEQGLLNERPPPAVASCKLKAIKDGELIGYISVGLPSGKFKERSSPLASRAWVLQEQLMSPRTLYFAPRGMYFQCNSHEQLETNHYPVPPERLTPWRTGEASDMPKTIIAMTTKDDVSYWYAVVRQYCFRLMTFGDDKLPALSGLAKVVAEQADEEESSFGDYLAGLWSNDLGRGLLWYSTAPYEASKVLHTVDRLAPTWSWASQNQPVDWTVLKDFKPEFELLAKTIELAGQNKFGRVRRAVLELKGHSVPCVLRRNTSSGGRRSALVLCMADHEPREAAEILLDATARLYFDTHWKQSASASTKHTFPCRLLRLGHAGTYLHGQRWYALLLCAEPAAGRYHYRRLGIAYSLGADAVHARSLTAEQSTRWLDNARSERLAIV